jgi:hypothetical protein
MENASSKPLPGHSVREKRGIRSFSAKSRPSCALSRTECLSKISFALLAIPTEQ